MNCICIPLNLLLVGIFIYYETISILRCKWHVESLYLNYIAVPVYAFVIMYVLPCSYDTERFSILKTKTGTTRLYFLRHQWDDNCFLIHCTCIRPIDIVEYAFPVFHHAIPNYLCMQEHRTDSKACVRIIFWTKSFVEVLLHSRLLTLKDRRQRTSDKLFKEVMEDPNHKLHPLLPGLNAKELKTDTYRNTLICNCYKS